MAPDEYGRFSFTILGFLNEVSGSAVTIEGYNHRWASFEDLVVETLIDAHSLCFSRYSYFYTKFFEPFYFFFAHKSRNNSIYPKSFGVVL